MKILFSHLKKFSEDIDIQSISESLFRLGHENQYDNEIIDIEFTPNGVIVCLYMALQEILIQFI